MLLLRLMLDQFRSYASAELSLTGRHVVLTGGNGTGKTNLLEALSMLSPGKGLRQARLDEMIRYQRKRSSDFASREGWVVSAVLSDSEEGRNITKIGIGLELSRNDRYSRNIRVNGEPVRNSIKLLEYVTVLWMTPAMDDLFVGPASDRRRFLNRLAVMLDGEYGVRVLAYEKALRSRNRLLQDYRPDQAWLSALEVQIAELGTEIAKTRVETVACLDRLIRAARSDGMIFPFVNIVLQGTLEERIAAGVPPVQVKDSYLGKLEASRSVDKAAARTLNGPHLTDLKVEHATKNVPAVFSSTGEQKAMLFSIILAHARLISIYRKHPPILLLDEVAAHLDRDHQLELFGLVTAIGGQCWMTGTDRSAFNPMANYADFVHVSPGSVRVI